MRMRHDLLLAKVAAILLTALAARAESGDKPYVHPATGLSFPASIGSFKLGEITKNVGNAGDDAVAVPYHGDGVEATVFIRVKTRDKSFTSATLLEDTMAGIRTMEESGIYKDLKIYKSDGKNEREGWSRAAFTAKSKEQLIASFIHCTVKNDFPIKLRVTGVSAKDEIEEFTKQIQDIVDAMGKK
jgi:hypothetical protein